MPASPDAARASWRALPRSVWALGFGSLSMDMSSELIHGLLPLFMLGNLGASLVMIGVIEGVAEATAATMKVFSGAISDYLGKRKALIVSGYALAALAKPIFPLATSIGWVFAARFVDRVGKGIRGAPRDALIADLTPPRLRGAAYGLRQALDSVGALLGPLLAVLLMMWFEDDLRTVMWFAVLPAAITVVLLVLHVREPEAAPARAAPRVALRLPEVRRLPRRYWLIVLVGVVLTLARFSEAFLVLRAQSAGLALGHVPAVMIVMNLFYAGAAYPAGAAADHLSQRKLLLAGLVLLIAADVVLALASSPASVFAGAALWGLHMGVTQGLLSKLVAEACPAALLGTGFGLFHLASGGALLLASVIAGALWSALGPSATFLAGAAFAAAAGVGVIVRRS